MNTLTTNRKMRQLGNGLIHFHTTAATCLAVLMAATAFGQNWGSVPGAAINGPVACPSSGWNCSAHSIAVDPSGGAWVLGTSYNAGGDYYIYHWQTGLEEWVAEPGAATQIAVGSQGYPWVVTHLGTIFYWNGSSFVQVAGCATSISVGPYTPLVTGFTSQNQYGDPWIIGCDGNVYVLQGSTWVQVWNGPAKNGSTDMPIAATQIAVSPEGIPWVVDTAGKVYVFSDDGLFNQVGTCAVSIAVGSASAPGASPNGDAWVTGCGGSPAGYNIWQYQSGQSWAHRPGTAAQISESPALGVQWAVDYFGRIYNSLGGAQ